MGRPQNKEAFRKELAESFAAILEEKGLEWKKEWQGGIFLPQNGITQRCYKGCNAFWLSLVSQMKGYQDPRWLTFRQIADEDGKYHAGEKWHLKKGSKATYVEYWYPYDLKGKKAMAWDDYRAELQNGRNPSDFKMSTRYTAVFNAAEIEGIPEIEQPELEDIEEDELIRLLSDGMGVEILNDGRDRAYYSPSQDKIHLPLAGTFSSEYAYNATALHELAHSTSHPMRLNRQTGAFFGTAQYAYEELVAEMASCFMGVNLHAELTPEHMENHKAYVQSWIQNIREKPDSLIRAIKDAQAAANYMDFHAGLITEKEYEAARNSVIEIKPKEKELER